MLQYGGQIVYLVLEAPNQSAVWEILNVNFKFFDSVHDDFFVWHIFFPFFWRVMPLIYLTPLLYSILLNMSRVFCEIFFVSTFCTNATQQNCAYWHICEKKSKTPSFEGAGSYNPIAIHRLSGAIPNIEDCPHDGASQVSVNPYQQFVEFVNFG